MDESPPTLEIHAKHLSRWQLFWELRHQGLIRSDWWFLFWKGLPSLALLAVSERVYGSQGMLDQIRGVSGPSLIESGKALADAYAKAMHADKPWEMHSLMLQIYKARVVSFCSVAMSSPSGYGQEIGIGFLSEWDRRIEWRLRVKGAHPEQRTEVERTEVDSGAAAEDPGRQQETGDGDKAPEEPS